jgi:hypothetical protein
MERNDLHETDLESAGATMMNELKRVEEMFASTPTPSRDR